MVNSTVDDLVKPPTQGVVPGIRFDTMTPSMVRRRFTAPSHYRTSDVIEGVD